MLFLPHDGMEDEVKNPGAAPLCALTQLGKSGRVTETKSERGIEAMREGGQCPGVPHRHLFLSSTSSHFSSLPSAPSLPLHITSQYECDKHGFNR